MTTHHKPLRPVTPSDEDARLAREASQQLACVAARGGAVELKVAGSAEQALVLPAATLALLIDIFDRLAAGDAVAVVGAEAELSTQQAAEALNVSQDYLVKLLDDRQLPHRKVGAHRRVLLRDVLAYKRKVDEQRLAALGELAAQGQDLGMGY